MNSGDNGRCQEDGIVFPLDSVFSRAVKTSFSFLHQSLLDVKNVTSKVRVHAHKEEIDPSSIKFGAFLSNVKCEAHSDVIVMERQHRSVNDSPLKGVLQQSRVLMLPTCSYIRILDDKIKIYWYSIVSSPG